MTRHVSLACFAPLALLAACSQSEVGPSVKTGCVAKLAAGDLVITEIMANPAGTDTGKEWFEVANPSAQAVDLQGLELVASKSDGTAEVKHVVTKLAIAASGRVVLGGAAPAVKPAFVTYDYGNDLGALRNADGRLALRCAGVLVDEVSYTTTKDGVARGFDGGRALDARANDAADAWCDATVEYEAGSKGSPGKANETCVVGPAPATCLGADGAARPLVPPGPGDVVISELMPNPSHVADEAGEWFELTLLRDVDLNGLQVGTTPGKPLVTITDTRCHRAAAGSQVILARSGDPAVNGGLPAVEATFSFGLPNASGTLWVGLAGQVLDQVSWTRSNDGASLSLDPGSLDPLANDDEKAFCAGQSTYGEGDKGTPGAPNDRCGGPVPTGRCLDGDTERDVRAPAPGDLVIDELLANPAGVDTGKEWFEVAVRKDVDLNGLQLGTELPAVAGTVESPACLPVSAGTLLVFAHNDGTLDDGGLPRVDFRFGFDLVNSGRGLFLARGGQLLDAVAYGDVTEGASRSLDPGALDPLANDLAASWCDGQTGYGDGTNRGTPGTPNSICAPPVGCLDGDHVRDPVAPGPGDLVISEIMADPSAVGDEEGEWFELTVLRDVDLNGVEVGTTPGKPGLTIADGKCRRRLAGTQVVFARSADPAVNGGLPAVESTFGFGLTNTGGTLYVGAAGVVLDQVTFPKATAGAARSLDPAQVDPTANDTDASWCAATTPYGAGDKGTPGAANAACGAPVPVGQCLDGSRLRAPVAPAPGDLVITELLPNPTGTDTGKEWFEVFVRRDVDLNGLQLGAVFPTVLQTLADPRCLHAAAGSYLVLAGNDGLQPSGGLPRVDVRLAFSLVNADRGVFVAYGGTQLDAVTYGALREGVARSLAPDKVDVVANDADASWCDARAAYGDGDKGSPGAANPACPPVVPPGQCLDGQTVRALVAPKLGDLVVSEVMANPAAVADTDGEWFEITVKRDVDVNGLELGVVAGTPLVTLADPVCRRRAAGSRIVFARSADAAVNGGLPAVEATFPFALPNSSGALVVSQGGTLLDRVFWATSVSGAARSLDPDSLDPVLNDSAGSWCAATGTYGAGDLGTPGAENPQCVRKLGAGRCREEDGTIRRVVYPAAGDVVISEVMQDPTVIGDATGEWFELTLVRNLDLNDLELGALPGTVQTTLTSEPCLPHVAGERLVVARSTDPALNGGLPRVDALFDFSLSNGSGSLFVGAKGLIADEITWNGTTPGRARSLDPDSLTAAANDDPAAWCPATATFGAGGNGSPGAPNEQCPLVVPPGMCLDGMTQTLRALVPPGAGDLVISEVMADPSAVADAAGEWFEVTLKKDADVNGLQAGTSAGSPQLTITDTACRRRAAGTRLVFAHGADPALNGGLPAPEATFGFGLGNAAGGLFVGIGDVVLDEVAWTGSTAGVALALDPDHLDPAANDDPLSWCGATAAYGAGDLGTPGGANAACPLIVPAGQCVEADGKTLRSLVVPVLGDLVITEVMPDPSAVSDGAGEWFEITVTRDVDLNGLELGTSSSTPLVTLTDPACRRRLAGSALVFAHGPDALVNGGLPAPEELFAFSLGNAGGALFVGIGGDLLDAVTWTATAAGASLSLDPDRTDPTDNDDPLAWCAGTTVYGAGDHGTPGAANPQCPIVVPAGKCLDADGVTVRDPIVPAAGDLVITELMANPSGDDATREWFEVTLKKDVDLVGLELGTVPGTALTTLPGSGCRRRTSGSALVFARNADPVTSGGLTAVEDLFGFGLGNTNGTLVVSVGGTVLDQVAWATSTDGVARSLDPTHTDPAANDDAAAWCAAVAVYGAGGKGTPGVANPACPIIVPAGQCLELDGMTLRPLVQPALGDLVIAELLAGQADPDHDWFEVAVKTDVDLNGLQVGTAPGQANVTITDTTCRRRLAGSAVVFARSSDPALNGGLPTPEALFSFTPGATGTVSIGLGGVALDTITWAAVTAGTARNLDPDSLDPAANDLDGSWCPATVAWAGGLGSPGAANEQCPAGIPAGKCLDGDGMTVRDLVAPVVGDLLITEIMNNPADTTENGHEWFEVLVGKDVDLAGLSVTHGANLASYSTTDCQRVTSGTYLLFSNGTALGAGLPRVDYGFTFSLVNSASSVSVSAGGVLLDTAAWTSSTVNGASRTLKHSQFTTTGNDTAANYCNSTLAYTVLDKGTPGADDATCL